MFEIFKDPVKGGLRREGLSQALQNLIVPLGVPGIAVHGEVSGEVFSGYAGERMVGGKSAVDEHTRFPIGCIIKTLVALTCCELHVRGVIDLEQPVETWLPNLAAPDGRPGPSLTQLMNHTAGYIEPRTENPLLNLTREEFEAYYPTRPSAFEQGAVWSYTQTSYAILGAVIQAVTGRDPLDIISAEILRPLDIELGAGVGMPGFAASGAHPHVSGTPAAPPKPMRPPVGAEFFRWSVSRQTLRVRDLAVLAKVLGGGLFPEFISPQAYRLYSEPLIDLPQRSGGPLRERSPDRFGRGLGHFGPLRGHSGSYFGATCLLRYDPDSGAVLAFATNAWNPGLRDRLSVEFFEAATGNPHFLAPTYCQPGRPISEFAGLYQPLMMSLGQARLTPNGEGLDCHVEYPGGSTQAYRIFLDDTGRLRGAGASPMLSIALASEPVTQEPYLFIGMSAYKRIEE